MVLTTVILAVAVKVSDYLAQELVVRSVDVAEQGLQTRWQQWRARRRSGENGDVAQDSVGEPLPVLGPEQLVQVRQLALQAALRQQLAEPMAQAVADGIVAELVTARARVAGAGGAPGTAAARGDGAAADGGSSEAAQ
ncbi:hypothetical protein [Streptomyces sp. NPDC050804]|uniref:hypothetical protein n=1 Tax=Streptomyces sp. NPDC050804 TaxID=3154745 RepID=UPI00343C5E96